jgi:DNA adenine methylase
MLPAKTKTIYTTKSPLRYPGGKTRAVKIITKYFPKDITEMCSPFFGGGSIELYMAANGMRVYGADIFKPLVEFWQCALNTPNALANTVQKYYPLRKKSFYELQQTQTKFETKLDRAAIFYVLNRSSFSGITLSGGMSPNHPRFTKFAIQNLRTFKNKNIIMQHMDFRDAIAQHPHMFLYLDPPYATNNALYGKDGNAHKYFDHLALHDILKQRNNWILSYNDCVYIRILYAGFHIKKLQWQYGMTKKKKSREILIFSHDVYSNAEK